MVKNLSANAGDMGSWVQSLGQEDPQIYWIFPLDLSLGRQGNGYSFQFSCIGNPKDRGAWGATVHGVPKQLDMTEQLNKNIC